MLDRGKPRGRVAEMLDQRLLGKGALRTEVPDFQGLLLRQASGHDFAEQAQQHFVGQRPIVAVEDLAQDLRLALGPVIVDGGLQRPFGLAHALRPAGAFGDQLLDLLVDAIYPLARFSQRGSGWRGWFLAAARRHGLTVLPFEIGHVVHQRLHPFNRHRVVDRGAHSAERAMALQPEQARGFCAP